MESANAETFSFVETGITVKLGQKVSFEQQGWKCTGEITGIISEKQSVQVEVKTTAFANSKNQERAAKITLKPDVRIIDLHFIDDKPLMPEFTKLTVDRMRDLMEDPWAARRNLTPIWRETPQKNEDGEEGTSARDDSPRHAA